MLVQATASSTTSSKPKRGRPRGQPRAERRLKRELADKAALLELLRFLRDLATEFEHAAINNPVIGVVTAIVGIGILHRFRIISDFDYAAALASVGALEVGQIAGNLANAISNDISAIASILHVSQSSSAAGQEALISPQASNLATVRGKADTATVTGGELGETPEVKK